MTPGAARDIAGRVDLPLPAWLFILAATLVLVVSFVALQSFWTTPRTRDAPTGSAQPRRAPEIALGVVGTTVFGMTILSGLGGTPAPSASFAVNVVYVEVWIGLVVVSVLFGDVFACLSPWRTWARVARRIGVRAGLRLRPARRYPERLGYWPAVVSLLVFAWLEVSYSGASDPRLTAQLCLGYAGVQLAGSAVYGIETWTSRGDALGVTFGLLARCSPVDVTLRPTIRRRPLEGFERAPALPGTAALACVLMAATTFDAFTATDRWRSRVEPGLTGWFFDRGAGVALGRDLAATAALLVSLALVVLVYEGAVAVMRRVRGAPRDVELGRLLAVSLLPIAAAYVAANGLTLLVNQTQALSALASDPLSRGDDLLGTAEWSTDYALVSPALAWYAQVAVLLAGHVLGLVLAHDRLLAAVGDVRVARRMQTSMLVAMVVYTTLALGLLAALGT